MNKCRIYLPDGQAVINSQSTPIQTVETVATAQQDNFQPVGDITSADTAFDAIPDVAGNKHRMIRSGRFKELC